MTTKILTLLAAAEREYDQQGWLESWRAFPARAIRAAGIDTAIPLVAIVDDQVSGGKGFGLHAHNNIEILSYPLEGVLQHRDSLGNGSRVGPGELQLMTAGTGIRHSEFNGSPIAPVRFLQIWIEPRHAGLSPGYQQIAYDASAPLSHLATPTGLGDTATLYQDVDLWRAAPAQGETVSVPVGPREWLWIHVVRGEVSFGGQTFEAGDGAAVACGGDLAVKGRAAANEALVFVMPTAGRDLAH